jgi:hypothetical protein
MDLKVTIFIRLTVTEQMAVITCSQFSEHTHQILFETKCGHGKCLFNIVYISEQANFLS